MCVTGSTGYSLGWCVHPQLCDTGREGILQVWLHPPVLARCGTAAASSWVLGRAFSIKNKIFDLHI